MSNESAWWQFRGTRQPTNTCLSWCCLCASAVLKRLSSRKVLQPHAGATLRFRPGPHTMRQQQSAVNAADQPQAQQQQQQQELEFQTDLLLLVAGNSRQMGRTVAVCPDALLDDGLLDFTLLSGTSLATQVCVSACCLHPRTPSNTGDIDACQSVDSHTLSTSAGPHLRFECVVVSGCVAARLHELA